MPRVLPLWLLLILLRQWSLMQNSSRSFPELKFFMDKIFVVGMRVSSWTNANKVCRHTILSTLYDVLFDVYCSYKVAKEIWDNMSSTLLRMLPNRSLLLETIYGGKWKRTRKSKCRSTSITNSSKNGRRGTSNFSNHVCCWCPGWKVVQLMEWLQAIAEA